MPFSFKRFHKVSPAILEIIRSTRKAATATGLFSNNGNIKEAFYILQTF
jgi:hypothetical protein